MTNKVISNKVMDLIAEQLCVDREHVTPAATLDDRLGADSLDLVELVMVLEEAFDIEIDDQAAEKAETVADVINLVIELGSQP